jgi:ADP-ribosylglycohydrolase/transcriptional regulator with XRE-family HTH domain
MGRRELADGAGISYSYLSAIETGQKEPSSKFLAQIAEALGGLHPYELMQAAEARASEARFLSPGQEVAEPGSEDDIVDYQQTRTALRALARQRRTPSGAAHDAIEELRALEEQRTTDAGARPGAPLDPTDELGALLPLLAPQDVALVLDTARRLAWRRRVELRAEAHAQDDVATDDGRDLIPGPVDGIQLAPNPEIDYRDRYRGAMVGTAVGDALGAAVEGRPPRVIRTRYGRVTDYARPTGFVTDDTEMALCIAESIADRGQLDPDDLADRFRAWSRVGRGMGMATYSATSRLADGVPWYAAGTKSAGNGAAMRAAPIGLYQPVDLTRLRSAAATSAVITHNDPTAVAATIVVAFIVAHLLHTEPGTFDAAALRDGIDNVLTGVEDPALRERRDSRSQVTLRQRIHDVFDLQGRDLTEVFALTYNGAFVLESLPASIAAFLATPEDPEEIIIGAVNGGYDADTVGAVAGAFAGAYHGVSGLPDRWVDHIEFRSGLEGVADELLVIAGLGEVLSPPEGPAPGDYAPFVEEGARWITRTHLEAAMSAPDRAYDIRLLPHPAGAERLATVFPGRHMG